MRIGYYQFRPVFGRVEKNLSKVITALAEVRADIVVLPELAFTGYHFADRAEVEKLAEEIEDSATVTELTRLCKQRRFHIVTGFTEKSGKRLYNSALLIGPKGVEHVYRKLHLFNNEKKYFDPGDIPLSVQKVGSAKIGMMVCFDWAFPEVARVLMLDGAEILCHPSNLVLGHCQQAMLTRCLENKVFAVTANRCGADTRPHGSLRFTGKSQIAAPGGILLHRSLSQREEVYITEIDPKLAHNKRLTPLNEIVADRRPDFYKKLSERKLKP